MWYHALGWEILYKDQSGDGGFVFVFVFSGCGCSGLSWEDSKFFSLQIEFELCERHSVEMECC